MTAKHTTVICECDRCNLEEIYHQDKRRSWSDSYSWSEWRYPNGWDVADVNTVSGIPKQVLLCPRCLQKFKETGE